MAEKVCDHTSVGMVVWRGDEVLLIERKKPPFGWAAPAGHVDGDESFEVAARRELEEEVGLVAGALRLCLEQRIDNPCRRVGDTWHHWKVYEVEVTGDIKASADEVKNYRFVDKATLQQLINRTKEFQAGKISEEEWCENPGMEPVWAYIFGKITDGDETGV
ncbi:MAG: NUDIX domain-containing protein [Candidatus Nomurabacteria bacterium]|jgi:ADP-ribose pyrophosphatase YjhB (NUDIX family)|nr:NUDIX domain-containing protein [Candidatus Nomurabacteria bacterium]